MNVSLLSYYRKKADFQPWLYGIACQHIYITSNPAGEIGGAKNLFPESQWGVCLSSRYLGVVIT